MGKSSQQLTFGKILHGIVPGFCPIPDCASGPGHKSCLGLGLCLGLWLDLVSYSGPSLFFNCSEDLTPTSTLA